MPTSDACPQAPADLRCHRKQRNLCLGPEGCSRARCQPYLQDRGQRRKGAGVRWLWRVAGLEACARSPVHTPPSSCQATLLAAAGPWRPGLVGTVCSRFPQHFLWHRNLGRFSQWLSLAEDRAGCRAGHTAVVPELYVIFWDSTSTVLRPLSRAPWRIPGAREQKTDTRGQRLSSLSCTSMVLTASMTSEAEGRGRSAECQ